jgi:hypothetical protein
LKERAHLGDIDVGGRILKYTNIQVPEKKEEFIDELSGYQIFMKSVNRLDMRVHVT